MLLLRKYKIFLDWLFANHGSRMVGHRVNEPKPFLRSGPEGLLKVASPSGPKDRSAACAVDLAVHKKPHLGARGADPAGGAMHPLGEQPARRVHGLPGGLRGLRRCLLPLIR